jgi:L-ribulokinase
MPFEEITKKAQALKPGQSGLMALDWMNGNRSILMNAELSGVILGLTLATKPEEVYRSLVEATAFGTKIIIDSYRDNGVPISKIVACGGLVQSELIMQIYADITGLAIEVAASGQAVALGSAICGAVAAGNERGGFDTVSEAVKKMTKPSSKTFIPNPESSKIYRELFAIYKRCHDFFGREEPHLMKDLKRIKGEAA